MVNTDIKCAKNTKKHKNVNAKNVKKYRGYNINALSAMRYRIQKGKTTDVNVGRQKYTGLFKIL